MKSNDNSWLKPFEKNIDYKFKNIEILRTAMTHSSYANENKMKVIENNERLEFLGDAIINAVVSQYLYKKYLDFPEGELTKLRAKVVC